MTRKDGFEFRYKGMQYSAKGGTVVMHIPQTDEVKQLKNQIRVLEARAND